MARTRWKKSGLHRHVEGSGPTHRSPWLCVRVSPTPDCVFPCTEQGCSSSQCRGVGVAVPTLCESLHWHLQFRSGRLTHLYLRCRPIMLLYCVFKEICL